MPDSDIVHGDSREQGGWKPRTVEKSIEAWLPPICQHSREPMPGTNTTYGAIRACCLSPSISRGGRTH
eukprot:2515265-Rhodomonas_salina.1